jgi:hypothetical protein
VERLTVDHRPAVVLDQTCFYPESGGQPGDRGLLDGVAVQVLSTMQSARYSSDLVRFFVDLPPIGHPWLDRAVAAAGRPYFRLRVAEYGELACRTYEILKAQQPCTFRPDSLQEVETLAARIPVARGIWSDRQCRFYRLLLEQELMQKTLLVKRLYRDRGRLPETIPPTGSILRDAVCDPVFTLQK